MKHPSITQMEMNEFVSAIQRGLNYEPKVTLTGDENSLNSSLIEEFIESFLALHDATSKSFTKSKEKKYVEFEKAASPLLVGFLNSLPSRFQFDPGFWSYLSFRVSEVIVWRYPPHDSDGWNKNFVVSHSTSEFVYGFLPRLAIKGLIASGSEKAENLIQQDFWQSHILRVKTGFSTSVSQAFAEAVVDDDLKVEKQRMMAKSIRSLRSNVIFEALDQQQAKALVNSVK